MSFFYSKSGLGDIEPNIGRIIAAGVGSFIFLIVLYNMVQPIYHVWEQKLAGEAELARATYNRRVMVQEAQAKKDAASLLGEAEVARAHGLAEANQIVGASLKGKEEYLRYLWIQGIEKVSNQIIYVPTESNLPVLEANRFGHTKDEK